jgi:transposase
MREMSVAEQRYQVVLAVLAEGRAVMDVASQWGVSRRTVHRWLARDEAAGLDGLLAKSHKPTNLVAAVPIHEQTCVSQFASWTICDNHIDKCESASSVAKYRARRRWGCRQGI